MRIIYLFLLLYSHAFCSAQQNNTPHNLATPIPYNTIVLKNNAKLIFSTTENSRILRLTSQTIDTVIISKNIKASERIFGWFQKDFQDYFMMYFDAGDTAVRVYSKLDGKILFFGRFINIDETNKILFFIDWKENFKFGLFDMNTMKVELYKPPKTACNFWWECIASKYLTEKELTLEYAVLNLKREKITYPRK